MPIDAKPEPWPIASSSVSAEALPGSVQYQRRFVDALGRPLSGSVTITGRNRGDSGEFVVLAAAPITVPVVDGELSVFLPPDSYRVVVSLKTQEGVAVQDEYRVELQAQ